MMSRYAVAEKLEERREVIVTTCHARRGPEYRRTGFLGTCSLSDSLAGQRALPARGRWLMTSMGAARATRRASLLGPEASRDHPSSYPLVDPGAVNDSSAI